MSPKDYTRLLTMPRGELIALVIELMNHVLRLQANKEGAADA